MNGRKLEVTLHCLSDDSTSKPLLLSKYPKRRPITMNYALKLSKQLSFGENCQITAHAVGAVLMLPAHLYFIYSYEGHGLVSAVGTSILSLAFFLMFLSSFTSMSYGSTHKYILRIIDHSMISHRYHLGSYRLSSLSLMNDWRGYLIITIQ